MNAAVGRTPDWKFWEGELVAGEFTLELFLGSAEKGAVFRTLLPSGPAAIKLVPAGPAQAQKLVKRWNRTGALDHPHLIRIARTGTWSKSGMSLAFVVMEYAEENLALVLQERALTAGEALEMLPPVAQALAFLHGHELVHYRLKPSNIFAINDTLKLSIETVSGGNAGDDLRALAATIVECLTRQRITFREGDAGSKIVDSLPQPFPEIVRNCAGSNGRAQWSTAELSQRLQSPKPETPAAPSAAPVTRSLETKPKTAYYLVALAFLGVAIVAGSLLRHRTPESVSNVPPPSATKTAQPAPNVATPPSAPAAPSKEVPAASSKAVPRAERHAADAKTPVAIQVLPEIPAKARRTIRGKVTVVVNVDVDESGRVTEARLQPGGSSYFGKLSLAAARKWRFAEGNSGEWSLLFDLTRNDTKVSSQKTSAR